MTMSDGTCAGKRTYETKHDAEKALGRARAKHNRRADRQGTRRGMLVENRTYYHSACGGFHLASSSRRDSGSLTDGDARWSAWAA